MRRVGLLPRILPIGLLLAAGACGPGPHAPALDELRCRNGDAACQSSSDPFLLELEVDLVDPDGDLMGGALQRFLDGQLLGDREPLDALLRAGGMTAGTTEGTLPVDLGLELSELRDGMRIEVAVQIEDAAGHASNRPALVLELTLR
ncbi:MAG: hypothetical protein P1V51_10365 [Deltaproteobacteria bacterium]|nr:hypothetical protein [Deltaproteobacteria bacterium]